MNATIFLYSFSKMFFSNNIMIKQLFITPLSSVFIFVHNKSGCAIMKLDLNMDTIQIRWLHIIHTSIHNIKRFEFKLIRY